MNLNTLILTKNLAYLEYRWITPKGVFWHSTGANNPNLSRYVGPDDGKLGKNQYGNHWNRSYADMKRKICPQFAIGKLKDGSIATYQLLPDDGKRFMRGHHSGTGKNGNGNDSYVGFEILEDSTNNRDYAMAVYREAIELTAYLCQRFNLDPLGKNVIIDHAEGYRLGIASHHGDVLHWFGKYGITLQKIRNDVAAEMKIKPPADALKLRLIEGTPYYKQPDGKTVAGVIEYSTNYTIIKTQGNYGYLKSGAGWVRLSDEPEPEKPPTPPVKPPTNPKLEAWTAKTVLKQGTKGKHVEVVQAILMAGGYDVREIDGDYGQVTVNAMKAYQREHGLTIDGWVGAQTWEKLIEQR